MPIDIGHQFCPATWNGPRSRITTWRVVRLFTACDGVPHAQLVASGNVIERRTVSCLALADKRLYRRVDTVLMDAAE